MEAWFAVTLFLTVCLVLMAGYPVAFTLAGVALAFAGLGSLAGAFDAAMLEMMPNRLFGVMTNQTLIAVPLFVFMGVMLERSKVARELLETMAALFGPLRGGLGVSVCLVGMLMAASTGIVGATVVTMGLLSLPTMLRQRYDPSLACGTICAAGTLGQVIPPSIVLVLLGDVMSNAYQQAQREMGIYNVDTVSVGDLFVGALVPGLVLVALYIGYILILAWLKPATAPAVSLGHEGADRRRPSLTRITSVLLAPLALIVAVLGSIMAGVATPTEAASVGAVGAGVLAALRGHFNLGILREVMRSTVSVSAMVFMILIGASVFSLVFRGFGGDELVREALTGLPGGAFTAVVVVMIAVFVLGFVLDFIEITFVVVPIVGPALLTMGPIQELGPVWLGVMIAVNLQTSFLTPPFGFALFYLRGVAPDDVPTSAIYRGVLPFIVIQLALLAVLAIWPGLVTWLPNVVYG